MGGVGTSRCSSRLESRCLSNLEMQLSLNSTGWGEGAKEELDEAGQGVIREGRLSSFQSKNGDLGGRLL